LLEVTGCDASVVSSVVSFLIELNGVGFRDHEETFKYLGSGFVVISIIGASLNVF